MRRTLVVTLSMAGAIVGLGAPLAAQAAPRRHFTEVEAGTRLSTHGSRYEDVYKIKKSPSGVGAAVRDAVLSGNELPASGTDQAISYYKDGRLRTTESFTLGVPHTNGIGTITGTGKCTRGSKAHRGETCNYKFSGTYDLRTHFTQITLTGTETLVSHHHKKSKH
jgi:hypothetical protein